MKKHLIFVFVFSIIIKRCDKQQVFLSIWRCRLDGRGRTTGNRVGVRSLSRVRISSSPPQNLGTLFQGFFVLYNKKYRSFSAPVFYFLKKRFFVFGKKFVVDFKKINFMHDSIDYNCISAACGIKSCKSAKF